MNRIATLLFSVMVVCCSAESPAYQLESIATDLIAKDSLEPKPNVLLIITDEHNFRTLGCYRQLMPREQGEMWGVGNVVRTPNIDRIAQDGVICTRGYATAPVCTPCRAALFTGRYPHMTGAPKTTWFLIAPFQRWRIA